MAMLQSGARAPDFAIPLLGGGRFSLAEALERGPALVVFVKHDCAACGLAYPYLERLYRRDATAPWSLLLIAQDRPEAIGRQIDRLGLTMPVAAEWGEYPVSRAFDPDATPTYFWIERDGHIGKTALGFAKKDLNEYAALLAGASDADTPDIAPPDDGVAPFKPG